MQMTDSQAVILILVMAVSTMTTRFLPFLVFSSRKKTPAAVKYLGKMLPAAVVGMLIVYCLKDVTPLAWPYGLPEAAAGLLSAGLYLWRRNMPLAIACGTVAYVLILWTL